MKIDRYIGLVHEFQGDGVSSADCVSLCRLFYREHGWAEDFTDGKNIIESEYSKQPFRVLRYLLGHFTKTAMEDLEYGDVVLLKVAGDVHLGVYTEYGKLLAMQVPTIVGHSKSTIYRKQWWSQYFLCGFRRKGGETS